uniref:Uncharacterized protein n=1 Tax=Haptolina ericina TaxID=156174 RepID=A0A7S3BDH7_9EUKA
MWMIGFKFLWMYMETMLLKILTEKLIALPFECALQTAQFVMTLGAPGFIPFIQAFMLETGIMIVKRIALDPLKFRVVRLAKMRVKAAQALKDGEVVPMNTPEMEAIGIMTDMLQLMYRYSVDALGAVISPVTISIMYLFKREFEITDLYGMRPTDLIFFMLFSYIMIPALWIVDIYVFNLLELIYNWKLFEYISFCGERFKNRARRWVGLDTAVNEELPPDLRSMDQMCFSVQFYLLGALHATGLVTAVLGYMLVLHKKHNMFGDIMVMPIFLMVSILMRLMKSITFRIADRYQIWVVEGDEEVEYEYDEGPGARRNEQLPPGMAAIDASIAECVEDAYAAGHSDETLQKLLHEAMYIPPGASIQAASLGDIGGSRSGGGGNGPISGGLSEGQIQQFVEMQAAGLIPFGVPSVPMQEMQVPIPLPGAAPMPMGAPLGLASSLPAGFGGLLASASTGGSLPVQQPMPQPAPFPAPAPFMGASPGQFSQILRSAPLPPGVPPPPVAGGGATDTGGEGDFNTFMTAFRDEIKATRDQQGRVAKYVPSRTCATAEAEKQSIQAKADAIYGQGPAEMRAAEGELDDFTEWPDELLLLGIDVDDAEDGTTTSTTTTTTTTTESEVEDETDDDDAWPLELLVDRNDRGGSHGNDRVLI